MADLVPIIVTSEALIGPQPPKNDPKSSLSHPSDLPRATKDPDLSLTHDPPEVHSPPTSSPSTNTWVVTEVQQPSQSGATSKEVGTNVTAPSRPKHRKSTVKLWIRRQMIRGHRPRDILRIINRNFTAPENFTDAMLWRLLASAFNPPRRPLRSCRNLQDFCRLLTSSKKILVLCGAGVSTACGIPDFRSRNGIYQRLATQFPHLPDPHSMFDIRFFRSDPRPFYQFARALYPGQFSPSPTHHFIRQLEVNSQLLRCYTQNIDTLERQVGLSRIVECHGSFRNATCTKCGHKVDGDTLKEEIEQQRIPLCHVCRPGETSPLSSELSDDEESLRNLVADGIYKPDIVFFGEGLPETFHDAIEVDQLDCDLLVVIGSSLKVKPVAQIPAWLPIDVPQILINREPLPHMRFDVSLYGDCDVIISHLSQMLGSDFSSLSTSNTLTESTLPLILPPEPSPTDPSSLAQQLPPSTFSKCAKRSYIFPGAEIFAPDEETDSESDQEVAHPPQKKIKKLSVITI